MRRRTATKNTVPPTGCRHRLGVIRYGKHFLLLTASAAALILLRTAPVFDRSAPTLVAYAVLHGSALVCSLREPASVARKILFIAISASLSVLTLYVGLAGRTALAGVGVNGRVYLALGFSSGFGALTYIWVIRRLWVRSMTFGWMVTIAGGCVLATLAACFAVLHLSFLGRWCLALGWWCALSGGLWLCERAAARRT